MKIRKFIFALCLMPILSFAAITDHQLGEVIVVNNDSDVANYCNFTNQIVVTKTGIVCVYNGKDSTFRGD